MCLIREFFNKLEINFLYNLLLIKEKFTEIARFYINI